MPRMEARSVALVGVFGALLGNAYSERRRRKREEHAAQAQLRGAARMVSAELGMAAISLETSRGSGLWVHLLTSLPTTGWAEHGAQLARHPERAAASSRLVSSSTEIR
jgi:hypothetical protein